MPDTSGTVFDACASDCHNVTHIRPQCWKSLIAIHEVTWDTDPDDNQFFDLAFPADHSSLGTEWLALPQNWRYWLPYTVEWVRAPRLWHSHKDVEAFGDVLPGGVSQGGVGDCWLLAAVATLAEYPGTLQRLFTPNVASPEGKYTVSLYEVLTSRWIAITLDDLIPCSKRWVGKHCPCGMDAASPIFATPAHENASLWPLLIEKAIAKYMRSYGGLKGGMVAWAWQMLTGGEEQWWYRRDTASGDWELLVSNLVKQRERMAAGDRGAMPFKPAVVERYRSKNELWHVMVLGAASNFPMAANIGSSKSTSSMLNSCKWNMCGGHAKWLVRGHAYSVIGVLETDREMCNPYTLESGSLRLVRLRNPGKGRWKGAWNGTWSPGSCLWDKRPDIREAALSQHRNPEEPDPTRSSTFPFSRFLCGSGHSVGSSFWMEFDDFCDVFTSLFVCPTDVVASVCVPNQ